MVNFTFNALLSGGPESYRTGISDLDISWHNGTPVLYAVSGPSGGVTAYQLQADGTAVLLDSDPFQGSPQKAAPGRLEEISIGGETMLVSLGWHENSVRFFNLNQTGQMVGTGALAVKDGLPAAMVGMEVVQIGGSDMVYADLWGRQGVAVFEIDGSGQLVEVGRIGDAPGPQGADLVAMEAVKLGGQDYLITASAFDNSVISYRLDASGMPIETARLDAAAGLSVTTPTAMVATQLGGAQYMVLAAAGSDSLSVLQVGADGALSITDHVLDDRTTRFDNVTALETVTIGDRVFVVAGGGDDGLSLFTLLPGGRLLHLAQIEDSAETALQNVTALELYERDGQIEIFATSGSEAGITHLSIDPGTLAATQTGTSANDMLTGTKDANLIIGGAGDDNIDGWGGDDIILDGAGSDTLRGGLGEDIFVLSADGETDTIVDFTLGVDRLDLSAAGRFYSLSSLTITPTMDGAIITAGNEEVILISSDYMPLTAASFEIADLFDIAHYASLPTIVTPPSDPTPDPTPAPNPDSAPDVSGSTSWHTAPSAIFSGAIGPGILFQKGLYSQSNFSGLATANYADAARGVGVRLDGGAAWGAATGDVLAGKESVIGSAFRDTLVGNAGDNRLEGGSDSDTLWAQGGNDALIGGDGADRLYGQGGHDLLQGGDGADTLDGGDGFDMVSYADAARGIGVRLDGGAAWGAATGDVPVGIEGVIGSAYRDTLVGNDGDNLLQGGGGDDTIYAQGGNDTLQGGDGADRLYGQGGFDMASYADAARGVGVRLDDGAAWGAATGDVLVGIEGVIGSAYRDTLVGNAGDNRFEGGGGDDTLWAQGGNDALQGGAGADRLYGQDGNDLLQGGTGADTLDGGSGFDMADYADATRGVGVRLDGGATWGAATGDVLVGIEGVIGSAYRDTLVGNDGDNLLQGGGGGDTLYGQGGLDVASYADAARGVGVRLDGGAAWGAATGDVLVGIEGLIGSAYRDTLVGNDGDNLLQGGGGGDTLYGQGGFDMASYADAARGVGVRLDGGAAWGAATGDVLVNIEGIKGSAYRDTLVGNNGDNRLEGGGGDDRLWAQDGNDALEGGDGADHLHGQGGSDRFIFADGFGNDTIFDFDATDADEQIDLSALTTITSYAALTDNTHMSQQGADVVIDDFAGNTITLVSVQLGDLDSSDFVF